ncbi:MAG: hypothetical protein ACE15E_25275 [Acidobacteriota bacterium]
MRKLICIQAFLSALVLTAFAEAQCSNGKVTIKVYSPIEYRAMPRRAKFEGDVRGDLIISAGGNAGSRVTLTNLEVFRKNGEKTTRADPIDWLKQPVVEAIASWRVINETGTQVSLPLAVEFRLSGVTVGDDPEPRNSVIFKEERLLIRVVAKAETIEPDWLVPK